MARLRIILDPIFNERIIDMDNKKKIIKEADPNEEIFCDYCDAECTMSSLAYGNQLMEDSHPHIWKRWDYICLDCAEKLSSRMENDEELCESMAEISRFLCGGKS